MNKKAIILFDSDCLFCNKSIQLILKRDQHAYFTFAPLNGVIGSRLKQEYHIPNTIDTLILIENGDYFTASTAALRIAKSLSGLYKLLFCFIGIPKPIRNYLYRLIATNRHKLIKNKSCPLPSLEERKRFLN